MAVPTVVVGDGVSIEVNDESGEPGGGVDGVRLMTLARHVLDALKVHPLAELSILAVDEDTMTTLHQKWMDLDGPTDVLSFPMDELRPGTDGEEPEEGLLGDVVLCPAVAARQAVAAGHGTTAELDLLTTHGILHLLGFDHEEPEEHRVMFALQAQLLGAWSDTTSEPVARVPVDSTPIVSTPIDSTPIVSVPVQDPPTDEDS